MNDDRRGKTNQSVAEIVKDKKFINCINGGSLSLVDWNGPLDYWLVEWNTGMDTYPTKAFPALK